MVGSHALSVGHGLCPTACKTVANNFSAENHATFPTSTWHPLSRFATLSPQIRRAQEMRTRMLEERYWRAAWAHTM
jgi:hypothetical protein